MPQSPSISSVRSSAAPFLLASLFLLPLPGGAQEAEGPEWENTSELSFLTSGGNSAQSSLGLRHALRRTTEAGEFRVDLATLRTDATRIQRRALGTTEDFRVTEDRDSERTAERWSAQGRYDHNLTPRVFTYGSAGWERNTFAGFNSRTVLSSGAGSRWSAPERWDLKVGLGLTYTIQDDVTPDPAGDDQFLGIRGTLDHERRISSVAEVELTWVVDANAEEWSGVRGDLTQSIATSLTDRLALKTTFQLLLDNDPPLQRIPLLTPGGEPTEETVLTPLRKRDQVLSVALVLTF